MSGPKPAGGSCALLLVVVAVVCIAQGGSLFVTLGIVLALLALPAYAMSREATRLGDEAQRKINLLEARGRTEAPAGERP